MAAVVTTCPACRQKLAFQVYTTVGTLVVCVDCETNLRIVSMTPLKLEKVAIEVTRNADSRPESYG